MRISRRILMAACCATLIGAVAGVNAQTWQPERSITMVVSYPPGGDTDAMARLYAEKLTQRLKQTVVVENRAGAGSQHIAAGKPVAVALTDPERTPLIPGLATVAEQGYPTVNADDFARLSKTIRDLNITAE